MPKKTKKSSKKSKPKKARRTQKSKTESKPKIQNKPKVSGPARLIVANWKMNPSSLKEAQKIFTVLKRSSIVSRHKIVLCPPVIYLADFVTKYKGSKFTFGAQDVSVSQNPETTGGISIDMLKDLKVGHVIIGHSEKRALGEDNVSISKKLQLVTSKNLKAILCVGEISRDIQGEYLRDLEKQVLESLDDFNKKYVNNLVIAYEPVWAMGKGHSAVDSHDLHQMNLFIKKALVRIFGHKIGMNIPIIYGGSVDDENARQLIESGEVAGLLIGRASLNPYIFLKIIKEI